MHSTRYSRSFAGSDTSGSTQLTSRRTKPFTSYISTRSGTATPRESHRALHRTVRGIVPGADGTRSPLRLDYVLDRRAQLPVRVRTRCDHQAFPGPVASYR